MCEIKSKFVKTAGCIAAAVLLCLMYQTNEGFAEAEGYPWLGGIAAASLILSVILCFFRLKPESRLYKPLAVITFFIAPLVNEAAVELMNGKLLTGFANPDNIWLNYLIYLLFYLAAFALFGSVRMSVYSVSLITLIFGAVNMYVKTYKGSPLLPWDIGSFRTAANVASSFKFEPTYSLVFSLVITFLLFRIASWFIKRRKDRIITALRAVCLTLFCGITGIFYGSEFVLRTVHAAPDFFNQTRGYENMGALAEFIVNTKYMSLSKPDGYSAESLETEMNEILQEDISSITETALSQKPGTPEETPDVIVIMDEAFSDLSVIGDFSVNEPYMPFIDSMKDMENVIEGNAYVSTIGTGTSNTEYEFLTGNSMAFLPYGSNAYQLFVDHEQPGLVSVLKDQNFSALALHPYYRSSWNRVSVYENMGFERFISIEDLEDVQILRRFASDEYDFNEIRRLYSQRDKSKPFFLFNITMQSHSSYEKKYENFPETVHVTSPEGEYPLTDQYLSLIKETDRTFEDLIGWVSRQERPLIVLMFGDHQPFIENSFYEAVMGENLSDMSDERGQDRYITRFIMYANYDIPEGWIDEISVNYLAPLLLENTGLKMTDYHRFQEYMFEKVPVITALGCRDRDGNYYSPDHPETFEKEIALYRKAAYNNLREDSKRITSLFEIQD